MRRALLGVAVLLTAACKDGARPTSPAATGTLNVQIEARTCSAEGSFDIEVYIDDVLVGTPTFMVGSTASFSVAAGSHTLGGVSTNGKFDWASAEVDVPAGGEYTAMFACH
jgi:hypothetical protein